MTQQAPHILEREQGAPAIPDLLLFCVFEGDLPTRGRYSRSYSFGYRGNPSKSTPCTALWRGYVGVFRLRADGRLLFVRAEFPFTPGASADTVNEEVLGDFWLDLRECFGGPGIRLPFRDGVVVLDMAEWQFHPGVDAHP